MQFWKRYAKNIQLCNFCKKWDICLSLWIWVSKCLFLFDKSIYVSLFYLCLSLGLADYLSLFLKISLILCYLISNIETVWVLLIEWISRRFCKYAFAMERRPTWNICNISNRVLPSTTLFSKTDTDVSNNQCPGLSRLW